MNESRGVRWYRTMGFKLAALVSVSILAFSAVTILLQTQRTRRLYALESIDCKIKLSTALEKMIRDSIIPGDKGKIMMCLDSFVEQNPDLAYICVAGPQGVLLTSSTSGKCPEFQNKRELDAYSTDVMRAYRVAGRRNDVDYLELIFYLSKDRHDLGFIKIGYYEMDAMAAERFRKVIGLERYIAVNIESMIRNFNYTQIDRTAEEMSGDDTNVRYVIVTDGDFRALSHPNSAWKFKRLEDRVSAETEKTGPYNPIMIQYLLRNGEEIMDVAMGVFDSGRRLGGIRIGYSLRAQQQLVLRSALWLAAIAFLLVAVVMATSIVIGRRIAAPVVSLSSIALKVGGGDLDARAEYKSGGDELRRLHESFNQMIAGLKERDLVKETFSRYVSKQVAEEILKHPDKIAPGGKKRDVTILFSDVRGFTTFAEAHSPEEVISHLNEYLSAMVDIIFKYEGTLDKFIGDAVMAVFGSPLPHSDDPMRAIKTALDMQSRLKELNEKWIAEGKETLRIGIGVNTGEVIAGNIGDIRRMEYTVIGDNVNLASRIEGLTKEYHCPIIISESTCEKVKERVEVNKLGSVTVKGKTQAIVIYELLGMKS
jgi:class 3 adenylate cyclase